MSTFAVIVTATNICDNIVALDDGSTWTPPADHYIDNIDGQECGIGWYHEPATDVWTAPPTVTALFTPDIILAGQSSVLSWDAQNATSVKINDQDLPVSGSMTITFNTAGTQTYTVTAFGLAGSSSKIASIRVVSTLAELGA